MRSITPSSHKRSAQSIVEVALILPVFLIAVMMIVQYSIIMNTTSSLRNLSREGARFAATQPGSDASIRSRMQQVCPPSINWSDVSVTITPAEGTTARSTRGSLISVTLNYNMARKLFLPSRFFGVRIFASNYTCFTEMMIE